jgi:microcystin-dependent protein
MSAPYVGELRMFGGNFPPAGWMTCDGQTLLITDYDTLFNLIGTTYGGDGQTTFHLPNLSGRVPVHMGTARSGTSSIIGSPAGVSTVTLTPNQIPIHNHGIVADNNSATTNQASPTNNYYGNTTASTKPFYSAQGTNLKTLLTTTSQGGSLPHENMQPYLAVTFIISLFGIFPSQ